MFKEAFNSLVFAALVGAFCSLAFVKIAIEANNQTLRCQPGTSKIASATLLGSVLHCKRK
jgi:hypothetical protein